jgi:hypothetical protein
MPISDSLCRQLQHVQLAKRRQDANTRSGAIFSQPFRPAPFALSEIVLKSPSDRVGAIVGAVSERLALFPSPPIPRRFLGLPERSERHAVRVLKIVRGPDFGFQISALADEATGNP